MASSSIYLKKKYQKQNGEYQIMIRVTDSGRRKYYDTGFHTDEKTFSKMVNMNGRLSGANKAIRDKLYEIKGNADGIIAILPHFTFGQFELAFLEAKGKKNKRVYHWMQLYSDLKKAEGKISTSQSYKEAMSSFKKFERRHNIQFGDITYKWLKDYHNWMLDKKRSISTIGIYMRNLSRTFTYAIEEGVIPQALYPFIKGKYDIPASKNIKKALSIDTLQDLNAYKPSSSKEQFAKDMFLFSFLCNGMNIADVLELKKDAIVNDTITFIRKKTANRQKVETSIEIALTDITRDIIERFRSGVESDYLFPIYNSAMTNEEQFRCKKQIVKKINQGLKSIGEAIEAPFKITTGVARHSYSTITMKAGKSLAFIQKTLGHSDSRTTEKYLGSFSSDDTKENTDYLVKLISRKGSSKTKFRKIS